MCRDFRLAVLSDVHYACAAEQAAGDDYEIRAIPNLLLRFLLGTYRHHIWLRYPLRQNGQLDRFLAEVSCRPLHEPPVWSSAFTRPGPPEGGTPNLLHQPKPPPHPAFGHPLPHRGRGQGEGATGDSVDHGASHIALPVDYVIANGDYCCNVAAVGLSDDAAMQSARECLGKLRAKFGEKLLANFGDHELGKLRLMGTRGGLRLDSWRRATTELGLRPFWQLKLGNYILMNVVSTLAALPMFEHDMLPEERPAWEKLREAHIAEIRAAFADLKPEQRVLLFCHDPTALPFLWDEVFCRPTHEAPPHPALSPEGGEGGVWPGEGDWVHGPNAPPILEVEALPLPHRGRGQGEGATGDCGVHGKGHIDLRARLPQIEQTIIGHLHSNLFLRMSRLLSGMPEVKFLGSSIRKLSTALNQARTWQRFHIRLCPSLAGIELLKDGGYLTVQVDADAQQPMEFQFHPLPR